MADGLFEGRTAVVTGGARGIGLACAAKIAAGGGRIALWDRDLERARKAAAMRLPSRST
jgi:NAD(P)-dependent dehydrogenase (short-subunit alcohol dehydrogenase family)